MEDKKTTAEQKLCNVFIKNRQGISLTGVLDVESFDDGSFIAVTSAGSLLVKGAGLHITRLNVEAGELSAEGTVDSCSFENGCRRGGFLKGVFK